MTELISIQLNGKSQHIAAATTVADLLGQLALSFPHIAVAVNDTIVPRSRHNETMIQESDRIELIQAVGGG